MFVKYILLLNFINCKWVNKRELEEEVEKVNYVVGIVKFGEMIM